MSGPLVDGACSYRAYLQGVIHISKRLLGLLKVSKDGSSTEHALIFVIVHVQDLFEGQNIDTVPELL
jgi:hypothetical protein